MAEDGGDLFVTVADGTEQPAAGAKVTLEGFAPHQQHNETADGNGDVAFRNVVPGQYRLHAAKGSAQSAIVNFNVDAGANITVLHVAGRDDKRYFCDYCRKGWDGVTNRRARQPLDPEASEAANKEVWNHCADRLDTDPATGVGRALDMGSEDYLCRRRWMDAYLSYVPDPCRKKDPSDAVERCKKPPPPPEPPKDLRCAVVAIAPACSHTDRVTKGATFLEVVPAKSYGSDKVSFEAKVQASCGKHPVWQVDDEEPVHGAKFTCSATAPATSKLWLPSFSPRRYTVSLKACNRSQQFQLSAYTANQLSVTLDGKKLVTLRKVLNAIETVLDAVADKWTWKWLEGKASFDAQWKEFSDHRAFYGYNIVVKFDPLFGIEGEYTIGPSKLTKWLGKVPKLGKHIQKAVDMAIQAGIKVVPRGGIGCDFGYKRESPDQQKFTKCLGGGISGSVGLDVVASASLAGKKENPLLGAELSAASSITGAGTPLIDDKGVGLQKAKIDWDGIKGNGRFVFAWGLVTVDETMCLVDPGNIWGGKDGETIYIYEFDAPTP